MTATLTEIKLSAIKPAPDNPRKELGDLTELAASMSELGMLQPLVVTPKGDGYMLVIGHRRHAAAKKAKLTTAPAIVRDLTDAQRVEAMVIENCQRSDLTTTEEARAYAQLVELGLSQREIAKAVGKSQAHISKRLQLLDLPEIVIAGVDAGDVTIGDALELVELKDRPKELKEILARPSWQTLEYAVRQAKEKIGRQEAVDAAKAKLEAKGITPIKIGQYGDPTPPAMRLGDGWNRVKIAEKAHAKLDCHAVGIDGWGKIIPICTKPENHPDATGPDSLALNGSRKLTAAEKRAEKERQELNEAEPRRLEAIAAIANGKVTAADLADVNLDALFARNYYDPIGWVCRMLEIPIEAAIVEAREAATTEEAETALEDPYDDLDAQEGERAIAAYAATSSAARLRVTFALAACIVEDTYLRARWQPWAAPAKALLTVLERHGYELTPAERNKLTDDAKEEAKAA